MLLYLRALIAYMRMSVQHTILGLSQKYVQHLVGLDREESHMQKVGFLMIQLIYLNINTETPMEICIFSKDSLIIA